MVVKDNIVFKNTYNKLIKVMDDEVEKYSIHKKYGGEIDHERIKILNIFYKYLNTIKESIYEYYYVNHLTYISNYLNK